MEGYILDWANLLLRWLHVIVAIAWIGSSFYFVWLDNSLRKPKDPQLAAKGVGGELWAVHGGGFYNPQKYLGAPGDLPDELHWFYWESYSTWLSGFGLFSVLYLFNPRIYLIDPSVAALSPQVAVAAALGFLVVGWLVYDGLCRALRKREQLLAVLVVLFVVAAAWGACHLFAGRAAFLIVGAMIATIMSANVFFWIIPGQRTTVASMKAGMPVDAIHGQRAKQRSVHNTYFTLPVLFAMLSNHYGWLHSHPQNWLVLILMMFAGAAIRQFFVLRHGFKLGRNHHPWPYALAGVMVLILTAVWLKPAPAEAVAAPVASAPAAAGVPGYDALNAMITQHCVVCHNSTTLAQKNVKLDAPAEVKSHAAQIYQQVVMLRKMPFGNPGALSAEERDLVKRWYEGGAPVQ